MEPRNAKQAHGRDAHTYQRPVVTAALTASATALLFGRHLLRD